MTRRVLGVCAMAVLLVPYCGQAQVLGKAAAQTQSTGQPQSAGQPQIASIRTQANLVLLDVVVTVNDGAIHGLGKDKFRVLDNGVPQQVTVFEEHSADAARVASPVAAKAPALGPNTYSDLPQSPEGSTANVLLLDALNTPVADQMNVRRQMMDYLKTVPAGTRIAVFTLASRLRMVEGFTTDASELAQALQSQKGGVAQQSAMLDQLFDQDVAGSTSGMGNMGADPEAVASFQQFQADFVSFETDLRVRMTLDALQGLARYLTPIPGRKNLIWFSGSFPLSIDPDSSQTEPFEAMRGYSQLVEATDGMLSAARVAVYPVDARGLMTDPSASVANDYQSSVPPIGASSGSSSGSGGRGGRNLSQGRATNTSAGYAAITADSNFTTQTMKEHATMQQIAQETGGEAFVDSNGIKDAVARAVANGANYYTVGYVPSFKGYDGSYHRLKVTVDGPYKTGYRQGYFAADLSKGKLASSQQLMTAALEQGAPPLSEILFKVRVQPVDATAGAAAEAKASGPNPVAGAAGGGGSLKGPVKRYALDYGLPAHSLAFPAGEDGVRHGRLEFTVVAYSLDGKRVNTVDQRADMDLKPALYTQILQFGIPMHQEIDLPVGRLFVRVVVHDMTSDRVGAIEVPVVVK